MSRQKHLSKLACAQYSTYLESIEQSRLLTNSTADLLSLLLSLFVLNYFVKSFESLPFLRLSRPFAYR